METPDVIDGTAAFAAIGQQVTEPIDPTPVELPDSKETDAVIEPTPMTAYESAAARLQELQQHASRMESVLQAIVKTTITALVRTKCSGLDLSTLADLHAKVEAILVAVTATATAPVRDTAAVDAAFADLTALIERAMPGTGTYIGAVWKHYGLGLAQLAAAL